MKTSEKILSGLLALCVVGTVLLVSKDSSLRRKQDGLNQALVDYEVFRQSSAGFLAEKSLEKIKYDLAQAGLSLEDLHVNENALLAAQKSLYNKDAERVLSRLRSEVHKDSNRATEMAQQIRDLKGHAGKPVTAELDNLLALEVARNHDEESAALKQAHGVGTNAAKRGEIVRNNVSHQRRKKARG